MDERKKVSGYVCYLHPQFICFVSGLKTPDQARPLAISADAAEPQGNFPFNLFLLTQHNTTTYETFKDFLNPDCCFQASGVVHANITNVLPQSHLGDSKHVCCQGQEDTSVTTPIGINTGT